MNNLPIETYESVVQQRDALAAENTAMKSITQSVKAMAFSNCRNAHNCGPFQMTDLCGDLIAECSVVTPATDALTRELMAHGVEEFSDNQMQKSLEQRAIGNHVLSDIYNDNAMDAKVFAARIRKGINDAQ